MLSVEWLVLAELVSEVQVEGRMPRIDIRDAGVTLTSALGFPGRVTLGLAFLLRFPLADGTEEQWIQMDVVDADNHTVLPTGKLGDMKVGPPEKGQGGRGYDRFLKGGVMLPPFIVPKAGLYAVVVRANGGIIGRAEFEATRAAIAP